MITSLYASGLSFKNTNHPNEMPFEGTLLLTDVPSNKAPNGSGGHRIFVPSEVAASRIKTIEGMGLNYKTTLDGHEVRRKVGVIKKAWLEGNAVKVKGIIWKKDFPEAVRDLKGKADLLGMSMEVSKVLVKDIHADVWTITDLIFTGATVLKAKNAAYHETTLAASAAKGTGGLVVKKNDKNKKGAAEKQKPDAQQGLIKAISAAMAPLNEGLKVLTNATKTQTKAIIKIHKRVEALEASAAKTVKEEEETPESQLAALLAESDEAVEEVDASEGDDELEASDEEGEDVEASDSDEDDVDAASTDNEDDDEDDSGDSSADDNDEDDVNAAADDLDEEEEVEQPKRQKEKSSKGRSLAAAAVGKIKSLNAQMSKVSLENRKMQRKIIKLEAQADKYAEHLERRSLTAEASAILRKGGVDPTELLASGMKLTTEQVDTILNDVAAAGINLGATERMGFKNVLIQRNLMEQGVVDRGYTI